MEKPHIPQLTSPTVHFTDGEAPDSTTHITHQWWANWWWSPHWWWFPRQPRLPAFRSSWRCGCPWSSVRSWSLDCSQSDSLQGMSVWECSGGKRAPFQNHRPDLGWIWISRGLATGPHATNKRSLSTDYYIFRVLLQEVHQQCKSSGEERVNQIPARQSHIIWWQTLGAEARTSLDFISSLPRTFPILNGSRMCYIYKQWIWILNLVACLPDSDNYDTLWLTGHKTSSNNNNNNEEL